MPTISGLLRFWSGDDTPNEVRLERVVFVFEDTYEPSLIVEEIYVAEVAGRRVTFGEYDGIATGYTLAVEGAEHAALIDWGIHSTGGGLLAKPNFEDGLTFEVRKF